MGDDGSVSLSLIIHQLVEHSYYGLTDLARRFMTEQLNDNSKKRELEAYFKSTRIQFARLSFLIRWTADLSPLESVRKLLEFIRRQDEYFVNTADELYLLQHKTFIKVNIQMYNVPIAIDILGGGTYMRLPTILSKPEYVLQQRSRYRWISDTEKDEILGRMNHILKVRLMWEKIPSQFLVPKVDEGRVEFVVKDEFRAVLTLINGIQPDDPWTLVELELFVNTEDSGEDILHESHVADLKYYVQNCMSKSKEPLYDLYNVVHVFCQVLQLNVLYNQAREFLDEDSFVYEVGEYFSLNLWKNNPLCLVISTKSDIKTIPKLRNVVLRGFLRASRNTQKMHLFVDVIPALMDPMTGNYAVLEVNPRHLNFSRLFNRVRDLHIYNTCKNLVDRLKEYFRGSMRDCNVGKDADYVHFVKITPESIRLCTNGDVSNTLIKVYLFDCYYISLNLNVDTGDLNLKDCPDVLEGQKALWSSKMNQFEDIESIQNLFNIQMYLILYGFSQICQSLNLNWYMPCGKILPREFVERFGSRVLVIQPNRRLNQDTMVVLSVVQERERCPIYLRFYLIGAPSVVQFKSKTGVIPINLKLGLQQINAHSTYEKDDDDYDFIVNKKVNYNEEKIDTNEFSLSDQIIDVSSKDLKDGVSLDLNLEYYLILEHVMASSIVLQKHFIIESMVSSNLAFQKVSNSDRYLLFMPSLDCLFIKSIVLTIYTDYWEVVMDDIGLLNSKGDDGVEVRADWCGHYHVSYSNSKWHFVYPINKRLPAFIEDSQCLVCILSFVKKFIQMKRELACGIDYNQIRLDSFSYRSFTLVYGENFECLLWAQIGLGGWQLQFEPFGNPHGVFVMQDLAYQDMGYLVNFLWNTYIPVSVVHKFQERYIPHWYVYLVPRSAYQALLCLSGSYNTLRCDIKFPGDRYMSIELLKVTLDNRNDEDGKKSDEESAIWERFIQNFIAKITLEHFKHRHFGRVLYTFFHQEYFERLLVAIIDALNNHHLFSSIKKLKDVQVVSAHLVKIQSPPEYQTEIAFSEQSMDISIDIKSQPGLLADDEIEMLINFFNTKIFKPLLINQIGSICQLLKLPLENLKDFLTMLRVIQTYKDPAVDLKFSHTPNSPLAIQYNSKESTLSLQFTFQHEQTVNELDIIFCYKTQKWMAQNDDNETKNFLSVCGLLTKATTLAGGIAQIYKYLKIKNMSL